MPKKMGINTKSTEAKARKDAMKQAERDKLEKQKDDELWRDDDKQVLKKQQRQQEKDAKRQQELDRKKEKQALIEQEEEQLSKTRPDTSKAPVNIPKVTRHQIETTKALESEKRTAELTTKKTNVVEQISLEENINKIEFEGETARGIDEALSVLKVSEEKVDQHPERRMKAAYAAFEDRRLAQLKSENPNLRLSQLKQMLRKEWMKHPDNPIIQAMIAGTKS